MRRDRHFVVTVGIVLAGLLLWTGGDRSRATEPASNGLEARVVVLEEAVKQLRADIDALKGGGRATSLDAVGAARVDLARKRLLVIELAVERFNYERNRYPANLNELVDRPSDVPADQWKPMLKATDLIDPWEAPFNYTYPGQHGKKFDLESTGADGRPGGTGADADLHNW